LYQTPLNTLIQSQIVLPAGLKHTFLCFYDDRFNSKELAPLWMNGIEVSQFISLSCDYSGGGLTTTAEDLTLFLQGCVNGILLTQESLHQMTTFTSKFRNGLHYGLGCMQLRPKDFFFLSKKLPLMIGHLGVTGVHTWIDMESKMSLVLNVGNNIDMLKSFQVVISLLQMMHSLKKRA
jgi:D-alanyl-D-alanine carboxypeptidase